MSRPFAMWIEHARASRIRGHQVLLSGAVLGRSPDPGDALNIVGPLTRPIRAHVRSLVGEPRGGQLSAFTLGISEIPRYPGQLVGGALVEAGMAVRLLSCRLRTPRPPTRTTARLVLESDRAWALVAVRAQILNLVVVGGDLGDGCLWDTLESIELSEGDRICRSDVEPAIEDGCDLWQVPTANTYQRASSEQVVVTPPTGPVETNSAELVVDHQWMRAAVLQQGGGLTQFSLVGPVKAPPVVAIRLAA